MTERRDINARLGYTCNCGWVDKGHARAEPNSNPIRGIYNLWNQITTEKFTTEFTVNGRACFLVQSRQEMQGLGGLISAGESGMFLVRSRSNITLKEQIACRILFEITNKFEAMQDTFPWGIKTSASSFSLEDATSNFLGLYAIINKMSMEDILRNMCKEVPKLESERIWDKYFENLSGTIGNAKYKRPVTKYNDPLLFPTEHCKGSPSFPAKLDQLKPASYSADFIPINVNITYNVPVYHFTFKAGKVTYMKNGDDTEYNMPIKVHFG